MYQTRLDSLVDRAKSTAVSLNNLRHFAKSNRDEIPRYLVNELSSEVGSMLECLHEFTGRLEQEAECGRASFTAVRAWRLVRLAEVGGIDREGCYELAGLCNPIAHSRFDFDQELCAALTAPWLIPLILDRTAYTEYIAGVFE